MCHSRHFCPLEKRAYIYIQNTWQASFFSSEAPYTAHSGTGGCGVEINKTLLQTYTCVLLYTSPRYTSTVIIPVPGAVALPAEGTSIVLKRNIGSQAVEHLNMIATLVATTVESRNNYSGKAGKINSTLLRPVLLSL